MIENSSLNISNSLGLFLLLGFLEVFFIWAARDDSKEGRDRAFSKKTYSGILVLIPILFVCTLFFDTYTTRRESDIISHKLTNSLTITLERNKKNGIRPPKDLEGKVIVISADDFSEKKLKFDKGEEVNIKIIEQQNGYQNKNKRDWTNARVYIVDGEKLYELSNDQIEEQGLDDVVKKLYKESWEESED